MAEGALSIKLRCASWQQLATIYKRDLSQGTMFLKAAAPPAVGTIVNIDLTLPSATVIALRGTVASQVTDPQRGAGIELKLDPIPAGSVWLIESALASEHKRLATPAVGVPVIGAHQLTSLIPTITEAADVAEAERDLIKALVSEAESLKKLNPFLVLGVGYEATDGEVRAAFGELTKRYHPDRFARYESAELRQVAAEIFILIRDAYRRLGDSTTRAQVLHGLGKPAPGPRAVPGPPRMTQPVAPPKPTQRVPVVPPLPPPPTATRTSSSQAGRTPSTPSTPPPVAVRPSASTPPPTATRTPSRPPATTPSQAGPPPPPSSSQAGPPPSPPSSHAGLPPATPPAQPPSQLPASIRPAEPRRADRAPTPLTGEPRVPPRRAATDPGATAHLPERRSASVQPPTVPIEATDASPLESLLDEGRIDEALAGYRAAVKKQPTDRNLRAGVELCEGMRALVARDRLEAAQRFEAALEIDPSNERAARELAEMRRQATNERKGLLSRLMGKKEP